MVSAWLAAKGFAVLGYITEQMWPLVQKLPMTPVLFWYLSNLALQLKIKVSDQPVTKIGIVLYWSDDQAHF